MQKTKLITVSALLTALSFIYTYLMPTIIIPAWSFTPFSHTTLMLGTMLSPYVGIMTALGTLAGFMLKTPDVLIWMRAASHIIFVLLMIIVFRTRAIDNPRKFWTLNIVVALVHAVLEVAAILVAIPMGLLPQQNQTFYYIFIAAGLGTTAHSIIDFCAAFLLLSVLRRAHFYFNGYPDGMGMEKLDAIIKRR